MRVEGSENQRRGNTREEAGWEPDPHKHKTNPHSPYVSRPDTERSARLVLVLVLVLLLPPWRGHDSSARPSSPRAGLRSRGTKAIEPVIKHRRPRHRRRSCATAAAAGQAVVEVAPPGHDQAVLSPRGKTGAVGAEGARGHGAGVALEGVYQPSLA